MQFSNLMNIIQVTPNKEKNPSKHRHYNDHYTDNQRQSPNFHCMGGMSDSRSHTSVDESSLPRSGERYQNKASYIERNKEKPEKEYVLFVHYAEPLYQYVETVRKSAVRVCGDWSEHISSSGKCYYYNCKTEVSRWEKPKEWVDKLADVNKVLPPKNKDVRERRQQHGHPIKKYEDRQKHSVSATATSSSSNFHQQSNSRPLSSFGSPAPGRHQPHEHVGNCTQSHKYKQSQGHPASGPNNATNSNNSQNNKSGHAGHRTAGPSHVNTWQGHDHIKRDGGRVPPVDRTYSVPERPNKSFENRDSQQAEDMDISPGSTPTEESMMERHALIMANTGSTPISTVTSTPPSTSKHSPSTPNILSVLSHLTSSSLPDLPALASLSSLTAMSPGGSGGSPGSLLPQLLQQLATGGRTMPNAQGVHQPNQQVLQQDGSQSPYSPPDESDGTPLQSPEHNPVTVGTTHQQSGHLDKTRQSPASEHSLISSRSVNKNVFLLICVL
ncbi:hypothetical protein LSH36_1392g00008 [Paralvinella palmiformis]|uniref:WW domain-containing protein n=1 Tax=Paralvinella palmiformis TaxID=53620 RepID=A0AAD9IU08_9ANNE|nr:hypothetical protein LSH36_1392g00008 [Paralvinella palmiformis]